MLTLKASELEQDYDLSLGQVCNLQEHKPGRRIFTKPPSFICEGTNTCNYAFSNIESSRDVRNLLDVSGEFSVQARLSICLGVQGAGSYLQDYTRTSKVTEILLRFSCETVSVKR